MFVDVSIYSENSASRSAAQRRDFSDVVAALAEHTRATRRTALRISGWEVGDPSLGPPGPLLARLAAIPPRLHGYTYPRDLRAAKGRAASLFARDITLAGEAVSAAHVAVAHNSTQALLLALAALRERGVERAVVASPAYFAALEACAHLGLPATVVPTADFLTGTLDVERIAALAGERSVLLLTNPAYSLGVEYTRAQLGALFAALPAGAWALLDETRLGLSWRYDAPWYPAAFPERLLVLRSPSKIFLVNGLKTSLLLAPPSLVRTVERLGEALLGSLPGNCEAVVLAYLDAWAGWHDEALRSSTDDPSGIGGMLAWKCGVIARLRRNLRAVEEVLRPAGFALAPIDSGPYVLAGAPRARLPRLDSRALAAEHGLLLMDSSYFYHESGDWSAFRINLCANPGRMRTAVSRLLDALGLCAPRSTNLHSQYE